eukprot:gene27587-7222_t
MEGNSSRPSEVLRDDYGGSNSATPKLPRPPSVFSLELMKLCNTVVTSATMGLIRTMFSRDKAAAVVQDSKLPSWMSTDYQKRSIIVKHLRNILKDTAAFTAAIYLMDGVEYSVKTLRGGTNDFVNKALGGIAAGGLLSQVWYPGNVRSRAILASTGAVVGYLSHVGEVTTKKILLDQQIKLEKEIYHKRDDEVKTEVDPAYLRELIKIKQGELVSEHAKKQAQLKDEHNAAVSQHRGEAPRPRTIYDPPGPSSAPQPSNFDPNSVGPPFSQDSRDHLGGLKWGDKSGFKEDGMSGDPAAEEWQYEPRK